MTNQEIIWDPEDYARNSSSQLAWARDLLAKLKLSGNEAILDVGCGDGKITAEVAGNVPAGFVLGVDSSAAFIDYARSHYPSSNYPNLQFKQMDARKLIFNRKFDIIFSNATLHWFDDHRAFLSGCRSLLKPGGRLIVSCGGAGNADEIIGVMNNLIQKPEWSGYFKDFNRSYHFYSPEEYKHWLPETGFRPTRLELVEKDMVHQGRDRMVAWLRSTWMLFTQRVPENMRQKFISDCADAYLEEHPLDDAGLCHVKMVRLVVEAHI